MKWLHINLKRIVVFPRGFFSGSSSLCSFLFLSKINCWKSNIYIKTLNDVFPISVFFFFSIFRSLFFFAFFLQHSQKILHLWLFAIDRTPLFSFRRLLICHWKLSRRFHRISFLIFLMPTKYMIVFSSHEKSINKSFCIHILSFLFYGLHLKWCVNIAGVCKFAYSFRDLC